MREALADRPPTDPSADLRTVVWFVPLSNWLRGYDRYARAWSKRLIGESRYPTTHYVLDATGPLDVGRTKVERLINRLAVAGDRVVALTARLPWGPTGLRPNTTSGSGIGWEWAHPDVPVASAAWVDAAGAQTAVPVEAITAAAYALRPLALRPWEDCAPRSFSVLPIANACDARCAFCFSRASVSTLARQKPIDVEDAARWAEAAARRGATRAVITGGGEPTLLDPARMRELIGVLGAFYPKVLLITNGSRLGASAPAARIDRLRSWKEAGLTAVAVSRHGVDRASDARILGLSVDVDAVLASAQEVGLHARIITVLQRHGAESVADIQEVVRRAARSGVTDVCLKELYISSLSENPWSASRENRFAAANQVPLDRAIAALTDMGLTPTGALPWGSPVFTGMVDGTPMSVAAYTEPSVGWERSHQMVRSWNWYADGRCLASLEDPASALSVPLVEAGPLVG